MTQELINKKLEEHKIWLDTDGEEGTPADLERADLYEANLYKANLYKADLNGANLRGADLRGADLNGAKNIASFSTMSGENRTGYAVKHKDCVMLKLGCFWGTSDEAIQEIREKYGKESHYEELIKLYTDILTKG